jgi:Cdc6-like AAA superfamily ATPase
MAGRVNPFNPNSVVTPALFAGRYEQVLQILKKLTQVREGMPASFVLQGDRGIGKTALAKLIMYAAEVKEPAFQSLKFLTSYYSVEKGQTFDSVLQASLNLMTDRMPESVIQRLTQRLGSFFRNGKFTVGEV